MSSGMHVVIGLIIFLLVIVVLLINSLIYKKNMVNNSFATIDVLLKKRFDLIPNIVAAVKGYMTHEAGVFTKITELRSRALSGQGGVDEAIAIDSQLTGMLRGLMVSVENYPVLKASENFLHLQRTLNEVEEQISASRRAFNAAVNEYNNAVQMVPTNIIAGLMKYQEKKYFTIIEEERKNVNTGELLKK